MPDSGRPDPFSRHTAKGPRVYIRLLSSVDGESQRSKFHGVVISHTSRSANGAPRHQPKQTR